MSGLQRASAQLVPAPSGRAAAAQCAWSSGRHDWASPCDRLGLRGSNVCWPADVHWTSQRIHELSLMPASRSCRCLPCSCGVCAERGPAVHASERERRRCLCATAVRQAERERPSHLHLIAAVGQGYPIHSGTEGLWMYMWRAAVSPDPPGSRTGLGSAPTEENQTSGRVLPVLFAYCCTASSALSSGVVAIHLRSTFLMCGSVKVSSRWWTQLGPSGNKVICFAAYQYAIQRILHITRHIHYITRLRSKSKVLALASQVLTVAESETVS